jgi:WD40 repeat protein
MEWIEAMRYSPDGNWLAIGSHDNFIYIYTTSDYSLVSKAQKHSSYIISLDWSLDSTAIKSTCGAYELLFWTVDHGRITQNTGGASGLKDETWASYSTHFGWHVQGIYGGVIDYTHVNRVDRSPDQTMFAIGNDWGLVEIFGNPNSESAKSKAYRGHSEHVTNVKWNKDGTYLFSTGGYD